MARYKFSCPTCAQRIAHDENAFGRKIRCPQCKTILSIPIPEGVANPAPAPPLTAAVRAASGAPPPPPPPPPRGSQARPTQPGRQAGPIGVSGSQVDVKPAGLGKPLVIGIGFAAVLAIVGLVVLLAPKSDEVDAAGPPPLPAGRDQPAAVDAGVEEPVGLMEEQPLAQPSMTPGDLAFIQRNAEALWLVRVGEMQDSPLVETAIANLGEGPQEAISRFKAGVNVDFKKIDFIAVAFSRLTLSARFAYVEQKAYLERRLGEVRSSTARKRVERGLESLRPPRPSEMLAKVRFKETVDLEKLLANAPVKESVEKGGKSYFRFKLPPDLRLAYPANLAAFQADATDILVGHETLVVEAMDSPADISLAELGLNQIDLENDILLSLNPSDDGKNQIKAILGHRLRSDQPPPWLNPAVLASLDRLSGGLLGFKVEDGLRVTASVASLTEDQARDTASAINEAMPKLVEEFDRGLTSLPAAWSRPLSAAANQFNARQDGLRVEGELSLPSAMFRGGLSEALESFDLAALFMRGAPVATPSTPPSPPDAGPASGSAAISTTGSPRAEGGPSGGGSSQGLARPSPVAARPTVPNRTLRGWTMNVLHAAIADKPLIGRIAGAAFQPDVALLESGVLILRMGSEKSPELIVEIHNLQRPGELIDGKTYELPHVSGVNTPAVFLRWRDPTELGMKTQRFYNGFAIKLEFDRIRGGRITGKVFVAVPDGKKSYINGRFDAEAR